MAADKIVRCKDMRLLFGNQLANRQGEILVQYIGIGLLGLVFPLFCSVKQSVVTAAEPGFYVSPCALQRPDRRAGFLNVMDAILMEDLFQLTTEACALQRLRQEVAFQCFILQVFPNVRKAFLAIQKSADELIESELHLMLSACVRRHGNLNLRVNAWIYG